MATNTAPEVDPKRVEEITSLYRRLARTPFIEQGWVKPDLPTTVMIQYSQRDLPRNKKNRIVRSFFEGESFSFKPFPFAMNMTNVVLMEPSPSWAYLAVLRSIKEKGEEEEKYLLEIWDNGCIASVIPTEGKHGQVYADSFFGSLTWSSDEKFLAYIAEKNPPKTSSFFGKNNTGEEKSKVGSKFDLREDWGETYRGGNPVIIVASVEKEAVVVVPGVPETLSAGQVQWAPRNKYLIFTGWNTEPRRLGIVHCYNRPSVIYAVPINVNELFEESKSDDKAKQSDCSNQDKSGGTSTSDSNNGKSNDEDTNRAIQLTLANVCSRSPRFSTDGKLLVYLASNNLETHNSASKLLTMEWIGPHKPASSQNSKYPGTTANTSSLKSSDAAESYREKVERRHLIAGEERVVIDIVEKFPENDQDFPGLFLANLPARCFIEERKIIFSSQWKSQLMPLLVDLQTGSLRKVAVPGCRTSNLNVQDVRQDVCALFDGSELNRVPFNFVGRWEHNKNAFRDWKVTPHPPSITEHAINVSELSWESGMVPLPANDPFNAQHKPGSDQHFPGIEYILTIPSNFGDALSDEEEELVSSATTATNVKTSSPSPADAFPSSPSNKGDKEDQPDESSSSTYRKHPIILFPHGGPHSANIPSFLLSPAFFASLGYAVLNVNYRGSLGFGKAFVDALPGHCGDMDVRDCHLALEYVLEKHNDRIDRSRIYVMGGSHGGFLTGHLLATGAPSPTQQWAAGVMINAVTNMAHCVGISDIPDWCYVESASKDLKTGLQTMFDMSPISRIHNVQAPTLIVLGASDKRVPLSQSIEYYHALKKQGTTTRLLKYPSAGHAILEPEQEADYLINAALWFEQHK